jgi:hypothetical protein
LKPLHKMPTAWGEEAFTGFWQPGHRDLELSRGKIQVGWEEKGGMRGWKGCWK